MTVETLQKLIVLTLSFYCISAAFYLYVSMF